ncbi:MAG: aspartate--tRNA(Asn) ligase [Candidatus Taylorbacteria bacterium]|nr:aspartate--tRNA(Asn) ligase [Candidatus Taylorbacteria bacterium]
MERTLIGELEKHVGETVSISGWVDVRRDHGKLVFLDIRDRSGKVQVICLTDHPEALAEAQRLRPEWVVRIEGIANERPEKMRSEGMNGNIELEAVKIIALAQAQELPFPKDEKVNLDTLLDNRPLTLRSERERGIFEVQATIVDSYRRSLMKQGFTEFQSPGLVGGDAEGGSAVFKVAYYDHPAAYLATSPQLYKQIMVGVFERVMTIAKVFRAEKSSTTRHLSESTQMDFEMGFINDEMDVLDVLESVMRDVVTEVAEKHSDIFALLGAKIPELGKEFPRITLRDAQEIVGSSENDLDPEGERKICEWAQREHGSDFVFITKFPASARAFYTMPDESAGPGLSRGFDLLFRGLEINSGAQRIHDYGEMVRRFEQRKMDTNKFSFYLQAFKYGMPPHGGCSTGLDRFTMKLLNLSNVREAALFPRDMNRIDTLLHGNGTSEN